LPLLFLLAILNAAPYKQHGLYISRWTMQNSQKFRAITDEGSELGINTLICDYNGEKNGTYKANLSYAKNKGLYCIARVEVFPDKGADWVMIKDNALKQQKIELARQAELLGFSEVQFDYIRFQDTGEASLKKSAQIEAFLQEAAGQINIPLQVDVFGSVAYHPHRVIGQDISTLINIVDTICPMLYPSHFFLDKKRMSTPYETMLEGSKLAKKQIGSNPVKLIPYIQGFNLNLGYSGLNLSDYIVAQIKATEKAETNGFYVWHPANDYRATFTALRNYPLKKEDKLFLFF
jgi:hypothetical protein